MAAKLRTFSAHMVLMILAIFAISMPFLYFGLVSVVKTGLADVFVDEVRSFARAIAENIEDDVSNASDEEITEVLDGILLSGRSSYAVLIVDGRPIGSSLALDIDAEEFQEDFAFGENGDTTYYVSLPLVSGGSMGVLQLGFDEQPINEHIDGARLTIVFVLLAYLLAALLTTMFLAAKMVRPIRRLKNVSGRIASGEYEQTMDVQGRVLEVQELARDLERMRSNLVGVNARLRSEIIERESAEAGKKSLESKLRHAQRLESLGTLAGGVAHEFNNVLQPLMLYTELALDEIGEDAVARRNLERVLELAYDAKGLSQQILTFGRIEGEGELQAINLAPVVDEALAMVTALLPATIDIRTNVQPDVGLISCDRRQIQQLIVNLCSNAFQSLSQGAGHIEVKYAHAFVTAEEAARHHGLRAGNHAVIEVSDTGAGMDEVTLRRIFEPFYTTQEVGEGSGLGLSVVHGIVSRHMGSISVASEVGEGTRFGVYLPIADQEESENSLKGEEHGENSGN